MIIRAETSKDFDSIDALLLDAFADHPHSPNNENQMVRILRDDGDIVIALVAEEKGRILGYVALSPLKFKKSPNEDALPSNWLGVGPLGVLKSCHNKGIGSALMKEALTEAQKHGYDGLILVGDWNYYKRFGFTTSPHLGMNGVPQEHVMFKSFNDLTPSGEIVFSKGFYI